MERIYQGSSKDVIIPNGLASETVDLRFSNRFSIADVGSLPYEIKGMGRLRHAIAVANFKELKKAGFETHFIRSDASACTITVEPFNIYRMKDYPDSKEVRFEKARGRIIPLEILDRQEVTQVLLDRAENDAELKQKMRSRVPSWPPKVGQKFRTPLIECTTKYRPGADVRLSDAEAIIEGGLGADSYEPLCKFVAKASRVLTKFHSRCGLRRVDGKWEIAITYKGPTFVIVDSYSPDEMRLIGPDGRSHDKDPLRKEYRRLFPKWARKLDAAKKKYPHNTSKWPPYPRKRLSQEFQDEFFNLYLTVALAMLLA